MKRFYMFCLVLLVLSAHAYSQRRRPAPTPPVITSNEEIKVSTNLIRVDVVVTDKKNRPVSNLNPGDFEIYEDGKKQKISDFSYVSSGKQRKTSRPTSDSLGLETGSGGTNLKDKIAIPTTSGSTGGGEIRRTFVIVVDNLGLSFRSVGEVKRSIRKFINEQVRRGDLVSILTTGRSGVLPAFTSNKKQLLATVKKIKWTGQSRGGADYYDPIKLTLLEEVSEQRGQDIPGVQEEAALLEDVELERKNNLAIATMRSLQYVVGGMSNLPGRKSLILFSEGFSLTNRSNRNSSVANADDSDTGAPPSSMNQFGSGAPDAVKALTESANQASVVIYPIDPRGLQYLGGAGADDDVRKAFDRNFRPGQTENKRTNRDYEFRQTQDGLRVLAKETGGFAVLNQNNLGKGLERVIDDQSYYLLGYITDMETIDGPKQVFEKVSVRLKDPDLRVRY
ncbi:MAG: VWA domain-containing protein, partial [Pyrinomonadaceae bacterium]|nr:VWA domain-containing protein [Pyrinomonadaceae bacterium]